MTEKEIIEGCINEDRRSQTALYKLYFPLMSSIGLRYTNTKEEALHGLNFGFLKVLRNINSYNPEYALATWIRNILVNHFIDEYRKNRIRFEKVRPIEESDQQFNITVNEGAENLDADYIRDILAQLEEPMRTIFCMFAIDGFRHHEISKKFDITEGTSRWYVNKARTILKSRLEAISRTEKIVAVTKA